MAIDRRSLLLGTLSVIAARPVCAASGASPEIAFASAARRGDGAFAIVLLTEDGAIVRDIPLSARGHDIALDAASGRAVAFARRPGTFAVAFETAQAREPVIFNADEGRHFYGHGAFSRDGRLLYVSENDIAGARGVIGIYDVAAGYRKIGEHASYGLGPHEIILLADGKTLAVANGGLDTVPEAARENLNLDAMEPSLTFVDAASGVLRAKHTLPTDLRRLSLRHIAADHDGHVWFGGQWEGELTSAPQLIGSAGMDRALRLMTPPDTGAVDLKGYIGSVAASRDGRFIAASAPKAGRIVYIDVASGMITAGSLLKDVCGLACDDVADFAATSGFGALRHERVGGPIVSAAEIAGLAFDNHLRRVG